MDWIIIIAAIPLIIAAFFLGRLFASKPIENNNNKIKEEYYELIKLKNQKEAEYQHTLNELKKDIENNQQKLLFTKEQNKLIENQYQERLQVIENTKKFAEEAAEERRKFLENEFQKEEKKYEDLKASYNFELNDLLKDIESIKETRRAAIASRQQELTVEENKENYSLILPREEERDIPILREVQYKISKPRTIAMAIWNGYYQPIAKVKFPKILGKQDVCGIYKITNQKTGECYIGQAVDVRKRWYDHAKAMIGIDTPQNNLLYAAAQKYGLDDFTFELLLECKSNELNEKEKYFIELYNSNTFGYNKTAGNN